MERTRPLAYESLKVLLCYLDPNLRFQLSRRCPSIKTTNKLIPIKVNKLRFSLFQMSINDTDYKLDIYYENSSECSTLGTQLTITSPYQPVRKLRNSRNTELNYVRKKLTSYFFENRSSITQVNCLVIDSDGPSYLLPPGLKFKVWTLSIGGSVGNALYTLKSIIHDSSFPLKAIEATYMATGHPMIKSAKQLVLRKDVGRDRDEWIRGFLIYSREQKVVYLPKDVLYTREFKVIIENWLIGVREVGTCYTFGITQRHKAATIVRKAKERFGGDEVDNKHIRIPINESSELHVSFVNKRYSEDDPNKYKLTIEIVKI